MNLVKFPKRQEDGSFCITVVFSIDTKYPKKLSDDVKKWFATWSEINKVWVRTWSNGEVERLLFEDDFTTFPYPIFCNDNELKFNLDCSPKSNKMWKDWLVSRIVPELKAKFPEILDFKRISNCEHKT